MGMFDRIHENCPTCGTIVEFQSKAGACAMDVYSASDAPPEILWDTLNAPEKCGQCGAWCVLFDPQYPPGHEQPKPRPQALAVLPPSKEDGSDRTDGLRWWPEDEPFVLAHIDRHSLKKEMS